MCCGCTACASICPRKAINMVNDFKGFKYPLVDNGLCVNCGLCVNVCDFKKNDIFTNYPVFYAVKNKKNDEISSSRSGAVFMAICDYVLSQDGYVFGCEIKNPSEIKHSCYNNKEGINHFKGSKYVQSDLNNCFLMCRDLLNDGKMVLFSGTGCQVNGLLSFLHFSNTSTDNLITCDLVCHGVPSQKLWNDYLEWVEKKKHKKIIKVDFRDKTTSVWKSHHETLYFEDETKFESQIWTKAYYSHLLFRESCFNCKYTSVNRKTDFTIADCWGVEKFAKEFDDDKGTSLLIVNSERAQLLFAKIKPLVQFKNAPVECILQPQLQNPPAKNKKYYAFWNQYGKKGGVAFKAYFINIKIKDCVSMLLERAYIFYKHLMIKIGLKKERK